MYSWLSCEVLTGRVIAELTELECERVSKQIGDATTASASLPLTGRTPTNWRRAILEGAAAMVLVDDEHQTPVWGGLVTHTAPDQTDVVPINLASYEAYLGRRYVGDEVFDQTGAVDIIVSLLQKYVLRGSNGGIPLRIQVEGTSRGVVIDREYQDTSDKTILSVLQELSGIENGPEWTIAWETVDNGQSFTPVFRISGTPLGVRTNPSSGLGPNATFEIPGPVSAVSLDRDYTDGSGANDVMATSTASGATRPQSTHVVTADPDRPTFELRYSPDTDIVDDDQLNAHARARAVEVCNGSRTLSLESQVQDAPRLGFDWVEGDDIGYVVGGFDRFGRDLVPAFPGGLTGVVRALGWELTLSGSQTITPVLEGPGDD